MTPWTERKDPDDAHETTATDPAPRAGIRAGAPWAVLVAAAALAGAAVCAARRGGVRARAVRGAVPAARAPRAGAAAAHGQRVCRKRRHRRARDPRGVGAVPALGRGRHDRVAQRDHGKALRRERPHPHPAGLQLRPAAGGVHNRIRRRRLPDHEHADPAAQHRPDADLPILDRPHGGGALQAPL